MTDGLDTLYVGSRTQVQQRLFKWLPWVDLDIFNSKVKYGKMLIQKISWKVLKILALKSVFTVDLLNDYLKSH